MHSHAGTVPTKKESIKGDGSWSSSTSAGSTMAIRTSSHAKGDASHAVPPPTGQGVKPGFLRMCTCSHHYCPRSWEYLEVLKGPVPKAIPSSTWTMLWGCGRTGDRKGLMVFWGWTGRSGRLEKDATARGCSEREKGGVWARLAVWSALWGGLRDKVVVHIRIEQGI